MTEVIARRAAEAGVPLLIEGRDLGVTVHERGTVVVIQGPRFASRAESRWYSSQGWEVINMTQYPEAILARLRPDVWAKGGDYSLAMLPEADLVASWGGQAVVLPYIEGHSTTRLMEEAGRRAGT